MNDRWWRKWRVASALMLMGAGFGCGGTSSGPGDADGGVMESDGGSVHALHIAFDTRFDAAGWVTADKRAVLEEAARRWGGLLHDDFPNVPAGIPLRSRHPEHPLDPATDFTGDVEIDDVLVFVGASDLPGANLARSAPSAILSTVPDATLRTALRARFEGTPFQPWTGWMSFERDAAWYFDATPGTSDDIPGTQADYLSTAMHELAHVLGFGTSDAFTALVDAEGNFTGAHAVALYGGPVPLSSDRGHFRTGVRVAGERPLMDASDFLGERSHVTELDLAVMRDLGY